jgi:hypothetical protein
MCRSCWLTSPDEVAPIIRGRARYRAAGRYPRFEVLQTDYGLLIGARRNAAKNNLYPFDLNRAKERRRCAAQALQRQEAVCQKAHGGVVVEAGPGASLEVVQPNSSLSCW